MLLKQIISTIWQRIVGLKDSQQLDVKIHTELFNHMDMVKFHTDIFKNLDF